MVLDCVICGHTAAATETFKAGACGRCAACGSISMFDIPSVETLRAYYAHFNDDYTAGMGDRFYVEMPKRHRAKLRLIGRYAPTGRLLDVGCGEGGFLAQAAEAGYEAVGCDFGLKATYPPGVVVKEGQLDTPGGLPFPDASFDIVTFWAVIEHVRDPGAALAEIRRVLKPGGFMFCDTPLVGDLCERLGASEPAWLGPPQHIHVHSYAGLAGLMGRAGFRVLRHYAFYERSPARWWMRRLRNLAIGAGVGGLKRVFARGLWRRQRAERVLPIADIQLAVGRRA